MSRIALRAGASRLFFFALAVAGALARPAAAVEPATEISALSARIEALSDRSRLLFDLTGLPPVTAYPVANPPRIIVDLPQVLFRMEANAGLAPGDKLIKSYRYGIFAPGRSRVVIDLTGPAKILKADSEPTAGGPRLVIELAPTSAAYFAVTAAEQARRQPADPPPAQPLQAAKPPSDKPTDRPVVVIDPGHGGLDMGATGKHGELEKDVVLEFARALRQKIDEGGQARVLLTRDHDMFLPLAERVRIARENNASLFVSIHADTLAAAHVEGATVYTVSERASDAEAARMAEKENLADQAAGLESKADAEQVGDILFELTRRETRSYSRQFSHSLISFWKEVGALNKNPSRSAGFVVLKAFDVPSVLLELGYLSSDKDLARLTSQEWRERAAQKAAAAVDAFISGRSREARAPADGPSGAARPQ
ncbi:N-acetylmuramoyl-L-alanine amidase [Methylocystis sp.]|uniref:N-acetylmuramoyl-L-alanine amidase n=1 Tax=Methylocystis sp. TaxID=1911079 RepID=UPI0025E73F2B|nr:N-acetylmuramoyl-L-alanine amidase [Methylocystis sp.]